jgi:hypothetical protein
MRKLSRLFAVLLVGIIASGPTRVAASTTPKEDVVRASIPRDLTKRCPRWEPWFRAYGLPPKVFSYVAWRESRCSPSALSVVRWTGKPDVGLLQIQGSWVTVTSNVCKVPRNQVVEALLDVRCNLSVARYLYQNGGLGHWSL